MDKFLAGLISYTALFLCSIGVSAVLFWAERQRLVDIPNERSSHTQPTPRLGGLPIVLVTLGGLCIYWTFYPQWTWTGLLAYLCGALIIAIVGWLDDLTSMSVYIRFVAQGIAAVMVIAGLGYCNEIVIPLAGEIELTWIGLPLSFIWIVGLTNAYNFMDGIDGIAGSQGLIAGLGWALIGCQMNEPLVSVLGALLAASCMGFLFHNWSPARIFMGDVGSTFLGYSFAVIPIAAAQTDGRALLVGGLLVWPFIFDSAFTLLRRLRLGEPIFKAHRSHLYQRLVIAGQTHRFVASLYSILSLSGMAFSLIYMAGIRFGEWIIAVGLIVESVGLWGFVLRKEQERRSPLTVDR